MKRNILDQDFNSALRGSLESQSNHKMVKHLLGIVSAFEKDARSKKGQFKSPDDVRNLYHQFYPRLEDAKAEGLKDVERRIQSIRTDWILKNGKDYGFKNMDVELSLAKLKSDKELDALISAASGAETCEEKMEIDPAAVLAAGAELRNRGKTEFYRYKAAVENLNPTEPWLNMPKAKEILADKWMYEAPRGKFRLSGDYEKDHKSETGGDYDIGCLVGTWEEGEE